MAKLFCSGLHPWIKLSFNDWQGLWSSSGRRIKGSQSIIQIASIMTHTFVDSI